MSEPPAYPPSYPPMGPPMGSPMGPPRMSPGEERTWAGAAHWGSLVAGAVALAFLGPLLVLLVKGDESPWVRRNAVESLNFQLSLLIYGAVAGALSVVLVIVTLGIALLLIIPLIAIAAIGVVVLVIVASVRTANGEAYRYPLTIRLIS